MTNPTLTRVVLVLTLMATGLTIGRAPAQEAPVVPTPSDDIISPNVPGDILGGAPNATLVNAALFAWQEFIALNWPANVANGREAPDLSQKFGNNATANGSPLVWQTMR